MSDREMSETQRISVDELKKLQTMLEDGGGPELTIPVTPQILARLDALLMQLQAHDEEGLTFQDAVQRVFQRGIEVLESEL